MVKFVDVFFSDYLPDRGGTPWPEDPGYLVDAENVYPTPNGWKAYPAATNLSGATAVPSTAGADIENLFMEHVSSTNHIFALSSTTWFQSNDYGASWNDVTPATAVSTANVGFDRYDDLLVLAPFAGQPREKDLAAASVAAQFVDLTGFTGAAVDVARVRDHFFIGTANGVRWSSIGDPQDYPTPGSASALASQAGSQATPSDLGQVRAVIGGEKFGLVFQRTGISRYTYVGGDTVYDVDVFEKEVGVGSNFTESIARIGDLFYFVNDEGVYVTDGYEVRKLSYGQIDESLFSSLVDSDDVFYSGTGGLTDDNGVDFQRSCILFKPDSYGKIVGINYRLNKFFTLSDSTIRAFATGRRSSVLTDYRLLAVDSSENLRQFTAAPSANLQTGFIELVPGSRIQIHGAYLLGSNYGSPTIAFKSADDPASIDAAQSGFTSFTASSRDVLNTGRGNGRWFAFRVTGVSGTQSVCRGLRVYYEPVSAK